MVLSESLGQAAVHILIDVAISNVFPKQCEKLNAATTNIRDSFRQKLTKKQDQVHQEISKQEAALLPALRDKVVDDVMKFYPCVLSAPC
jgi:hypothetical protein